MTSATEENVENGLTDYEQRVAMAFTLGGVERVYHQDGRLHYNEWFMGGHEVTQIVYKLITNGIVPDPDRFIADAMMPDDELG